MRCFSRSSTRRISALARQERQDRAGFGPQGPHHRVRHLILDARTRIAAQIARLDREGAAFAGDDGSIAREAARPARRPSVADIGRMRRSSRKPRWQSSARASPRSASSERSWNSSNSTAPMPESSGSSRISLVKTPSVTTSMRVFGPDFETIRARNPIRSPTASDKRVRHALGGSPRGDAARLQHQDLSAAEPAFVHQCERNACRLAGAGRRDEDSRCARGQGAPQFVQDGVYRKRRGKRHGGLYSSGHLRIASAICAARKHGAVAQASAMRRRTGGRG